MRTWQLILCIAFAPACTDEGATEILAYETPALTAQSHVMSDTVLVVSVTAANETSLPIRYTFRPICGAFVRVHVGDPSAPVAWDGHKWSTSRIGGCKGMDVERTLAPGRSEVFHAAAATGDILGDSLTAGEYGVSALLILGDPEPFFASVAAGRLALSQQ